MKSPTQQKNGLSVRPTFFKSLAKQFQDLIFILGMCCFFFFAGHFAIGSFRFIKHGIKNQILPHFKSKNSLSAQNNADYTKAPAFRGVPEIENYFVEKAKVDTNIVQPYYHWRRKGDLSGISVQVDPNTGTRRTIKNPKPNAKKVFFFGGSTAWGTGVPDRFTIPSLLQKKFGDGYDFYNYGESAYVSVQELNRLLEQLSFGNIPDAVIFYDGVNDTYAGVYSPGIARHPQWGPDDYAGPPTTTLSLLKLLLEQTNYIYIKYKYNDWFGTPYLAHWDQLKKDGLEKNAQQTTLAYEHLIKQVEALGKAYHFKSFHFWQPVLSLKTKKTLDPWEQNIINAESQVLQNGYTITYAKMKKLFSSKQNTFYIADTFDHIPDALYFDFCHVSQKGNELIAEKIYHYTKEKL